jgi:DNA polymerase-3 subunit beta
MKRVVFTTTALRIALEKLGKIVSSNTVTPILEDVKFEIGLNEAKLTASDLENTLIITIPCESTVKMALCIPHKDIYDLFKSLPEGSAACVVDEELRKVQIETAIGKITLSYEDPETFPGLPDDPESLTFKLTSEQMEKMFIASRFSSSDTLRPAMTGVCLHFLDKELRFVATDAHRLYRSEAIAIEHTTNDMIVMPVKAAKALATFNLIGEVECCVNATTLSFRSNDTAVYTRLIDARFPDYTAIIPAIDHFFSVDKSLLTNRMRLIALAANKSTNQIVFDVVEKNLGLSASDVDFGKDANTSIDIVEKTCPDVRFALNAKLMEPILSSLGDEIRFHTEGSPSRAFLFMDTKSQDLFLQMPLMTLSN